MFEAIAAGVLLGLSAGLTPGPLMALVLAHTLQHGPREGCKIAFVPLITDAPIILLALLLAAKLPGFDRLLGVLSMAGGAFVLYLAWECLHPVRIDASVPAGDPQSWRKGILTNLFSPSPWVFWFTVGMATLIKLNAAGWLAPAVFLGLFFAFLCGTKVVLAVLTGRSRAFFSGQAYRLVLGSLGLALVLFAGFLFRDGLRYFGWLAR